jgi:type I restriction-modification system DNA methylase subunit
MARESSGKGVIRLVNHEHIKGQKTLSLLQRLSLIEVPLDAEEPSLIEMLLRLRKAFDAEQITKKFFKEFAGHQKKIVAQIEGLEKTSDKEWYSSLILNRLMFIYFMQWKGFMDGNRNYLADRLQKIIQLQGENQFFGFFKDFLLPLFHKGLGEGTEIKVPVEIATIVGRIPYVNGGIFSEHELELKNDINIPDKAFMEIFAFFDNYQWHLDSRQTGNKNEINPDVLGYVFEQFVNNKEQGAYYTKEDITAYMTSNALVPRLINEISDVCEINIYRPLVENPDRYIWPSLKFGEAEYQSGELSGDRVSLPGESSYETVARFEHLNQLREEISKGKFEDVGELITLNIDLELLLSDIIDGIDTSDDVYRIWKIMTNMKILDPTCGSGAFLFAALNQLEQIYSVLLDVADIHSKTSKNANLDDLMTQVAKHPSRNYFILKHAAQNNLYGVDLMRGAAEIARLRLFLKLISAIDSYEDIEPLPDLEFNIKSGNLLIGITKSNKIAEHLNTLDALEFVEDIDNKVVHLADLWENFLISQELGSEKAKNAKKMLQNGTQILRFALDKLFYENISQGNSKLTFEEWKEISSPFHWFVEFPDVFQNDGFDVVLGNPPYIRKNKVDYDVSGHQTSDSPDIYAICMERAADITNKKAFFAMIVMLNLVFSERYEKLREFLSKRFGKRWVSGYGNRPSMLFDGVEVRNTIFIGAHGEPELFSSPMHRWTNAYRPHLMTNIRYSNVAPKLDVPSKWPFITSPKIFDLLTAKSGTLRQHVLPKAPACEVVNGQVVWDKSLGKMAPLFYMGTARYWISSFKIAPPAEDGDGNPVLSSKLNTIWFTNDEIRDIAFTLFVSKWMFVWWAIYGDDFDVTRDILLTFPIDIDSISDSDKKKLVALAEKLQESLSKKIIWQKRTFPDKRVIKVGNWDLSGSKDVANQRFASVLFIRIHF